MYIPYNQFLFGNWRRKQITVTIENGNDINIYTKKEKKTFYFSVFGFNQLIFFVFLNYLYKKKVKCFLFAKNIFSIDFI